MTAPQIDGPLEHREIIANGVRLHYVEAGEGPLVILLHGFPEFWYSWRRQIPALAAAGLHVIAPDMRGYNTSEKPPSVRSYAMERLTGDVAALIRASGAQTAAVAGHDWGGAVAWATAMDYPDLVERLIVLNAPHPAAFQRELRTLDQLRRSWYIAFFQVPFLPEALLRAGGYAAIKRVFETEPLRKDAFTRADVGHFVRAASQPGALTAAINYYRALFRDGPRQLRAAQRVVAAPTLLIWGEQDRYLGSALTEGLEQWVPHLRLERLPNASHWVQLDAADEVNRLMLDFLRRA